MSSSKRRKVDKSKPIVLSAIARRKLQTNASLVTFGSDSPIPPKDGRLFDGSALSVNNNDLARFVRSGTPIENADRELQGSHIVPETSDYDEGENDERPAGTHDQELPFVGKGSSHFTSIKPDGHNIKPLNGGGLRINILAGERLVVLGQYNLSVIRGRVTLLGGVLSPSDGFHAVYALPSHSLPVIRCLAELEDEAEIQLEQYDSGLSGLGDLSPLFQKLGVDEKRNAAGVEDRKTSPKTASTFQIIYPDSASSYKFPMWPIVSPPEWNVALSRSTSKLQEASAPITVLCGPKSSGKSTFATLLTNRLLTYPQPKHTSSPSVAFLDLDPGQPEYSVPGQMSLVHLKTLNLGPSFSHPCAIQSNNTVRSHSIGAITPAADPEKYMDCVKDLLSCYKQLRFKHRGCPLIINTPGWVQGTGLELLVDLIKAAQPSEVIYMSTDGPSDVVRALQEATGKATFFTLPSQQKEYMTRTAAHLRTMQTMSYFHNSFDSEGHISWNSDPLSSIPPLEVQYSGSNKGFLGILCIAERPPPEILSEAIDGNLVAVVVVDDTSAFLGLKQDLEQQTTPSKNSEDFLSFEESVDPPELSPEMGLQTAGFVVDTPEGIPYFDPAQNISLDPRMSYSLGLALIRGIDTEKKCLQILTPILMKAIDDITDSGKSLVLVSGKLDIPGWAYNEELNLRANTAKRKSQNETEEVLDIDELSQAAGTPWIEELNGHQGRGAMNRVWRVRRDLGKGG